MNSRSVLIIAVLYLATAVASFGGFRFAMANGTVAPAGSRGGLAKLITPEVPKSSGGLNLESSLPKTEACPLNGELFTEPERAAWEKRRPLAVMIENHMDARPQSGLGKGDVVYEIIAEGGITRFMSIYLCAAQAKDIIVAPVRSARQYFIDYASDYNFPLYAHVGGANGAETDPRVRALENLTAYGWTAANDLNQFSIGFPVFAKNDSRIAGKEVATEHTMESSTERLWTYAATKRGLTNVDKKGVDWQKGFIPWTFADDAPTSERGTSQVVSYEFWEGFRQFAVEWTYDNSNNSYKRVMAGEPHVDLNDNQQLAAKNVVVLLTKEEGPVDSVKHMYYKTSGTGKAIIFQNGKRIDATWSKKDRTARLQFTDAKGKPVAFVRGKIWISVLPDERIVTVQ